MVAGERVIGRAGETLTLGLKLGEAMMHVGHRELRSRVYTAGLAN